MKITLTSIPDVLLIESKVFGDDRGFFFESFNQAAFNEATGLDLTFVQDNHSKSAQNVLRGLHYQLPPKAQGKLVRAVAGEVFDVAVDIGGSCVVGQGLTERTARKNRGLSPTPCRSSALLRDRCLASHEIIVQRSWAPTRCEHASEALFASASSNRIPPKPISRSKITSRHQRKTPL